MSLEVIFGALQQANARYIVVGGLAVVAYGYSRLTMDVDLVLDLSSDSLNRTLPVFQGLGFRPNYPVSLLDFANPELRREWIEQRNMTVFSLVSDRFPDVTIDLFVDEPFAFEEEFAASEWRIVSPQLSVRVVSLPRLIALKKAADRHRDRDDIEQLRKLHPEIEP